MKRYEWLAVGLAVVGMLTPNLSSAQHTHGHGSAGGGMKMDTREVLVEGVKVTFQVMANEEAPILYLYQYQPRCQTCPSQSAAPT